MTILIVDDEPDIRDMLKDALENDHIHVITASTGEKILEVIEKNIPDLIILDLLLPGEHGLDLVTKIKKMFFIPILIISGVYKLTEIQSQLETTRVEGFFEKPLDIPTIRALIKKLLM